MSNELIMHGPVQVELKVHIMNPETNQRGVVTLTCPAGKFVDPEYINQRINGLSDELLKMAPGFIPMSRDEVMASMIEEHTGQRVHVACPREWDNPTPDECDDEE